MDEVSESDSIIFVVCSHHEFCGPCIREWLRNGFTCPLCRAPIRALVSPLQGFVWIRYLNHRGEEVDIDRVLRDADGESQEGTDDDETEDEDETVYEEDTDDERVYEEDTEDEDSELDSDQQAWAARPIIGIVRARPESAESGPPRRRQRQDGAIFPAPREGLVAPNPTPEDTPNPSPGYRLIFSEDSDGAEETEDPLGNVEETPTHRPLLRTLSIGISPPRPIFSPGQNSSTASVGSNPDHAREPARPPNLSIARYERLLNWVYSFETPPAEGVYHVCIVTEEDGSVHVLPNEEESEYSATERWAVRDDFLGVLNVAQSGQELHITGHWESVGLLRGETSEADNGTESVILDLAQVGALPGYGSQLRQNTAPTTAEPWTPLLITQLSRIDHMLDPEQFDLD
jgi:hypothetical protein